MVSLLLLIVLCSSSLIACLPSEYPHNIRAASKHKPISFQQRNLNTITALYNRTVYPTNLEFIANGSSSVPKGLFNANVSGRITPIGNFTGFQDSVEYFFALAPIPQSPLYHGFSKAQIVEFSSECPDVAASVVYFTESIAFWEFDDKGAVSKYDAWVPNLGIYHPLTNPARTNAETINLVCSTVQAECTGKNAQYASVQNCVDVLSAKPFGDWDEVWMDSVVHCPHVGPTGGGKCINEPYEDGYILSDEALFGKPAGQNFVCGGKHFQ
ncbi:hypothetical protein G7Y79_00032g067120 [Physcia stellaris]|nr:hypothetical protein G7Y79_00032g067120 [Physcia stellaris]